MRGDLPKIARRGLLSLLALPLALKGGGAGASGLREGKGAAGAPASEPATCSPLRVRRIVTDNGPDGRSRILRQADVKPGDQIWESSAQNPLGTEPRDAGIHDLLPGGVKAVLYAFPTDAEVEKYYKAGVPGVDSNGFHRTGTLDLVMLLKGKLGLEVDKETVWLEPGDVVVQRDTRHAWRNPGPDPAQCLVVISTPVGGPIKHG